jgi:hypothetical protein
VLVRLLAGWRLTVSHGSATTVTIVRIVNVGVSANLSVATTLWPLVAATDMSRASRSKLPRIGWTGPHAARIGASIRRRLCALRLLMQRDHKATLSRIARALHSA